MCYLYRAIYWLLINLLFQHVVLLLLSWCLMIQMLNRLYRWVHSKLLAKHFVRIHPQFMIELRIHIAINVPDLDLQCFFHPNKENVISAHDTFHTSSKVMQSLLRLQSSTCYQDSSQFILHSHQNVFIIPQGVWGSHQLS